VAEGGSVTSLKEICLATPRAPFFLLLYVGTNAERASRLRTAVEEKAEMRGFFHASSRTEAAELVDKRELRVGWLDGCLLVVWDLGDQPTRGIGDWLARLPRWPSGQVVAFLIAETEPELSFQDFLACVDRDFAGVGDFETCLARIEQWCTPGEPPDFGLPFLKRPSRWLRDLKHDYIVNTVLIQRSSFEALGLLAKQREIDLIVSVLRNLLAYPDSKIEVRGLQADYADEEGALYRKVYSTPFRIVAPADLTEMLAAEYEEGVDFVTYRSSEEAAERLVAAARDGCARILLQAPDAQLPEGSGDLPVVLIAEPAQHLGWQGCQERLSTNVIGSYSVSDLPKRRSGKPLLVAQRPYWRACAALPFPALFDRLIELLVGTWAAAGEPKLKEDVFRSLAVVASARAVYLGQTGTGDGP
jgi:hypothetical protein